MSQKKVLITGGLGYVGGRISKYLAENTDFFIKIGSQNQSIKKPNWLTNGEIVDFDLKDNNKIQKACDGVDYIIHLAAMNEIDCVKDPEEAILINVLGTLKLVKAASNIERFLYFSTAHVYGAPLDGDIDENKICFPTHPYSYTHKAAEDIVLAESENNTVVRLSNSFGYPERFDVNRWTLVVNDLCRQAVANRKLVLKSNGLQMRDFITLEDVARASLHLLELSNGGIFNLGGEKVVSIVEMTELIAQRCEIVLGYKPEIILNENDKSKSLNLKYSIEKLKSTEFALIGDINKEIDGTLELCKKQI